MTFRAAGSFANQVVDECSSTNDLARQLGEAGAPHGTWVSAKRQTAGRGRIGRKWEDLEGNLFLSLIVRVEDKKCWTWVPLAAAIGVTRALKPYCSITIKWPNDLWVNGAKLGGILCEAIGSQQGSFIIIGLGLNCFARPELAEQATADLGGVQADAIRSQIIAEILQVLSELVAKDLGPATLAASYDQCAVFPRGTAIQWKDPRTDAVQSGEVEGLGTAGELLVRIPARGVVPLYAEDIRAVRRAADESLA